MVNNPLHGLVPLAALAVISAAQAQSARPDPLNPHASIPPLVHESPFTAYRGFAGDKPIPWKEANDTVRHIGGWRAYARDASPAETPAPAPSAPPGHHGPKAGRKGME